MNEAEIRRELTSCFPERGRREVVVGEFNQVSLAAAVRKEWEQLAPDTKALILEIEANLIRRGMPCSLGSPPGTTVDLGEDDDDEILDWLEQEGTATA